jgi:hypothetical protein
VLSHKIREALASETKAENLFGEIEVDGAYFGGHVRPKTKRKIARTVALQNIKPASAASWWPYASVKAAH